VFYTQESARFIPVLESKLAVNRRSPIFARLASYYLMEGKVDRTVELCLEGLHHFPHYPAAHLILGKAYEAQGRHVEAMLEYQKAKRAVPDNPVVVELLRKVELREQDAFRAFAQEREQKLQERRNTIAFERYAGEDPPPRRHPGCSGVSAPRNTAPCRRLPDRKSSPLRLQKSMPPRGSTRQLSRHTGGSGNNTLKMPHDIHAGLPSLRKPPDSSTPNKRADSPVHRQETEKPLPCGRGFSVLRNPAGATSAC
jgi:hypothetical protein